MRRFGPALAVATGAFLALASTAFGNVALTQISSDPFTNATAVDGVAIYHATQVEPDTFSFGSTIVAAFQVGRFHNGGADDIGFATSTNGGQTWRHGLLPGLTFQVDPKAPTSGSVTHRWPTTPSMASGWSRRSLCCPICSYLRCRSADRPMAVGRGKTRCPSRRPHLARSTCTRTGPRAATHRPARITETAIRSSITSPQTTSSC